MPAIADFFELVRDIFLVSSPNYTEKNYPNLTNHVYIVTGGTSGIGYECARLLLQCHARVYITGRTPAKVTAALTSLSALGEVKLLPIHHEDLLTVRPAIAQFLATETQLNGIVHNAGINYRGPNLLEPYDLLDIIVINVLAAQLVQALVQPLLSATPNSRAVWVTSAIHYYAPPNGIVYDEFSGFSRAMNEYDQGGYLGQGNGMYGQTKAMNIFQAVQWGKRFPNTLSVSVHPGTVATSIRRHSRWRDLVLGSFSRPSVMGAYAVLQPLLDPAITTEDSGTYFTPFGRRGRVRPDVEAAARGERGQQFWDWIEAKIAVYK